MFFPSIIFFGPGQRVLVYDTSDGSLIQPLKGHKVSFAGNMWAETGRAGRRSCQLRANATVSQAQCR